MTKPNRVAIIMGSKTDLTVMGDAADILKKLSVPYDITIVSAHRTPQGMVDFATNAHKKYSVIIAGAGGAAHLPGMVASLTTLPVIGVPVTVGKLKGIDALLSIVQMPKGVPVATVAIDNAENAGLLAARILGISNTRISQNLTKHQTEQKRIVRHMNQTLRQQVKKR